MRYMNVMAIGHRYFVSQYLIVCCGFVIKKSYSPAYLCRLFLRSLDIQIIVIMACPFHDFVNVACLWLGLLFCSAQIKKEPYHKSLMQLTFRIKKMCTDMYKIGYV